MKNLNYLLTRYLLVIFAISSSFIAKASIEINGLYYDLNTSARTATLTYETTTSSNYSSLQGEVVIPSTVVYNGVTFTVTTISDKAFANCVSLTSISIPGTVTSVGTATYSLEYLPFYGCTALKSVRFEDGASLIYLGARYYDYYSSSYTGSGLFVGCPLEEVYIGRNIKYEDYNSSYPFASYPSRYGYSAFCNQSKLAKVTIGENVSIIQQYAFYKCSALTTVTFGNSLTEIPQYAFYGCKLTAVTLPNTVTRIREYAFYENSALASADLGDAVTQIDANAFYGCSVLDGIILPSTLKTIGNYAFYKSGLKTITVPNSVTSIGDNCFENNKKLTTVTIGSGCKTLPASVFAGCSLLSNVTLLDGLTTISNKAFANCVSLTSISIPGTVTSVGTATSLLENWPFYGCTALKSVRFEDGASDIILGSRFNSSSTGSGLFYSCPLEEVYIGRNIKYEDINSSYRFASYPEYYGYSAFYNQSKLAKVTIGEACTELTDYLFYKNAAITLLNLPKVKKIGKSTFEECSKLTTLNLGSSIEQVGERAFYNCVNITKLTFPNTINSIGSYAFYNCTSITEVTVGNILKSIGSYAFYNCKSFTAIILPDCFTTMGASAFENCTKLTVAKLGQSLTAVPNMAFKNCTSLSEIVIPATAKSIGDQAFYNNSGLATITMNEGLETIGSEVFYNNSGIMRFTIPGTVTSMGANCFYGCTNVTYLIFKDGTGTLNIDNKNCRSSKIDALTTNTSNRDMKYDYFYDCPIRFLTIGKNITYSGYSASVSIYDPDKKTTINRASAPFVNHTDIRSVTIGQNVTLLYHHLLNGCNGISKLTIPSRMQNVYSYAIANCTNLESIIFNEGQGNLSIGNYALSNCPELTELIFPSKTVSIGDYACADNTKLESIIFMRNRVIR